MSQEGKSVPTNSRFESELLDTRRKVDVAEGPQVSNEIKDFLAEKELWKTYCELSVFRRKRLINFTQSASSFLSHLEVGHRSLSTILRRSGEDITVNHTVHN